LLAHTIELALVAFHCIGGDVFKDGVTAQLATNFGLDNERIGLALTNAELGDVVLDVSLIVVVMVGIVELSAARRFQIVDPGQPMPVDEIGVKAKSYYTRLSGDQSTAPARSLRFLRIISVMCSPPGS
jgi:hypothetical protein